MLMDWLRWLTCESNVNDVTSTVDGCDVCTTLGTTAIREDDACDAYKAPFVHTLAIGTSIDRSFMTNSTDFHGI